MNLVAPEIENYAAEHTSELPDIYQRLREETYASMDSPQMQVGRLEGRFLKLMTQLTGARLAVEVGTFTGYSALSIAEGLPDDGKLITLDKNPTSSEVARRYFAEAPWGSRIEHIEGPALDSLKSIDGPIDLAFIDADKVNYINYWNELVPKLRPGGLVLVDNVLWSGAVLDPQTDSARAIVAFNRHAASDDRVEKVLLTVRDGVLMARKK